MSENAVVRARIDPRIKAEAITILNAIGLSISNTFQPMMVRIAREKSLPFEPLIPNSETVEAMRAARRGELFRVGHPDDLLASLNADS